MFNGWNTFISLEQLIREFMNRRGNERFRIFKEGTLLACVDEKGYLPRALFEPPEDGRESVSVDALVRLKKYGYMDDEPIQEE